MQRIFNGTPIYTNPESFPYSDFLYTPIYIYSCSLLIWISKLNIFNDVHQVYILARSFSFLLVICQLVYFKKIINKITGSFFHYLVVISMYLLLLNGHIFAIRPDALKVLLFSIFFFHLIQFSFFTHIKKDVVLAVIVGLLAVYTKQDIVIHISICLITLLFFKREKIVFYLVGSFFLSGFLLFICCQIFYGKYFFANLVLFNFQQVENLFQSYIVFLLSESAVRTVPLLLVAFYNLATLNKNSTTYSFEKYLIVVSIISFPVAHLLLLRAASNLNYTYELIFFLVINVAIFLKNGWLNNKTWNKVSVVIGGFFYFFMLIYLNYLLSKYEYNSTKEKKYKAEYTQAMQQRDKLNKVIGNAVVFFPHSKYMVLYNSKNLFLGHDMHIDRFLDLVYKIDCKTTLSFINFNGYDADFKNGFVQYIVLSNSKRSAEHIRKYYPGYVFYKRVDNLLIYRFADNNHKPPTP